MSRLTGYGSESPDRVGVDITLVSLDSCGARTRCDAGASTAGGVRECVSEVQG